MNKVAEQLNNEGVQFFIKGHINKAVEKYNLGLKEDPKSATILNNLGMLSLQQKKNIKAIDYFEKAFQIKENITYKLNLGHAKANLNLLDEAEIIYKECLKIESYNLNAWKSLGSLYQFQKKHEDAIQIWEIILTNYSSEIEYKIELAKDYISSNQNNKALNLLVPLTNSDKFQDQIWYFIAIIHFRNKNLGLAKKTILKSLAIQPINELYRATLAKICLSLNEFDKALKHWNFIIKLNPKNNINRIEKSKVLLIINEFNEAINELNYVLNCETNNYEAMYFKAIALLKIPLEKSKAIKILKIIKKSKNKYSKLATTVLEKLI